VQRDHASAQERESTHLDTFRAILAHESAEAGVQFRRNSAPIKAERKALYTS
jgi:hypothetical protein